MGYTSEKKLGVILSYTNLFISTLIPFFYTPIMLNVLGKAEYGLYSLSSSVTSYLNLLNFGMTTTVMRYIIKYKSENDIEGLKNLIGLFTIIYSFLSLIIIIVGTILSVNCNTFFSKGLSIDEINTLKVLILIMTFNIPITLMGSIYSSMILSYEKFTFKYCIDIVGTISMPILNLIVLYMGYASIGMTLVSLFMNFLFLPINIYYCYRKLQISVSLKKLPIHLVKDIFSFSFVVFMSSLADLLFWATDKVLIGSYLGSIQVAIYNIGGTFTNIFKNMASSISGVFSPQANSLVFEKKTITESSDLLIKVGRIQYLVIALVLSGFIVFGQDFLLYWAGSGYEQSYYIALLTMIPLTIPLIQNIAYSTIMAMSKHRFRSNMYILISIINVISTWLILPYYGIIGAAICTALSYVVGQGIILNIYYWKVIKLDIVRFWKNIIKMSIIPLLLISISLFLSHSFIVIDSLLELGVYIIIYTIIYCIFSWLFSMNEYEKSLVKDTFNKLLRRSS